MIEFESMSLEPMQKKYTLLGRGKTQPQNEKRQTNTYVRSAAEKRIASLLTSSDWTPEKTDASEMQQSDSQSDRMLKPAS